MLEINSIKENDSMARVNKNDMEFNFDDFDFDSLASDAFGTSVITAKLNPSIQGKVFTVYGNNNTGKTKQCSRMVKNSFIKHQRTICFIHQYVCGIQRNPIVPNL